MKKTLTYEAVVAGFTDCTNERSDYEAEWRTISDFLLPGRGIYGTSANSSKPKKRQLSSPKVVNTVAEEALYILTSGMHGGLTSPSRPWFKLDWSDTRLSKVEPLKQWLQECESILHTGLHASNFYSIINSFYTEYAGFGNGCLYIGEDVDKGDESPFRFELLTAGEYAFSLGSAGKPIAFYRIIYLTPAQVVEKFPDTVSAEVKKLVEDEESGKYTPSITVLECVTKRKYRDKAYTQIRFELPSTGATKTASSLAEERKPLSVEGFYEFPYPIARWDIIGSDTYGIGLGSRSLRHIKRLQELEKALLMATHKSVDPPVNVPARLKGKLNRLPGGENYYTNPQEVVTELYQGRVDYQGINMAIERIEQRIQRIFCTDIFLSGARDPNASPYKAAEVVAREQEKMLRLGPVVERLLPELLQPVLERCFNIMLRKGRFPELSPELAQLASGYEIRMVSPLATAQRSVELQSINTFLAFLGQAAQFSQEILDNVDADAAARDYADITGVRLGILRPVEQVQKIREQRAQQMQAQVEREKGMQDAQLSSQMNGESATAQKTQAEAGVTFIEGQQMAKEMGMI
jgi:hypothetical protein